MDDILGGVSMYLLFGRETLTSILCQLRMLGRHLLAILLCIVPQFARYHSEHEGGVLEADHTPHVTPKSEFPHQFAPESRRRNIDVWVGEAFAPSRDEKEYSRTKEIHWR